MALYRADSDEYESEVDDDVPFGSNTEKTSPVEPPRKNWDLFQEKPPENESLAYEDQKLYQYTIKCLKYVGGIIIQSFCSVVTFAVILTASVISKVTLLLMTSQLAPSRTLPLCLESSRKRDVEISLAERIQWTWAIYFCFLVPEILTFIRSLRIAFFKGLPKPSIIEFLVPLFFEVCHTVGLGIFTFTVLPSVHVVKAAMLGNAVCLLPAFLSMISRRRINSIGRTWLGLMILDFVAIIFQLVGLLVWPLLKTEPEKEDNMEQVKTILMKKPWLLLISATLISFGWWENFVSKNSRIGISRMLAEIRKNVVDSRYHSYVYISIIKMLVFLATMCLSIWIIDDSPYDYFNLFEHAFSRRILNSTEMQQALAAAAADSPIIEPIVYPYYVEENAAIYGFVIQFTVAYACYFAARFACKICIQGFSFSFPLSLSVPVSIAFLVSMCGARSENVCFAKNIFPAYLYWECPGGDFMNFLSTEHSWIWILLLLSQTWITIHIWYPSKNDRLARTDTLFCRPLYNAILTDQDLVLNQKQSDLKEEDADETTKKASLIPEDKEDFTMYGGRESFDMDKVPKIIACATMWHENAEEMIAMFKSIFRMDADQCARRVQRQYFEVIDPGYYEYETHIFFDDTFQLSKTNNMYVVNDFVRLMIPSIEKAATLVHGYEIFIPPPKKIPTPYGGRLEFTLPGKTKLTVHLKDKKKIRHRKRWSQCMYMYYLLGYRLMDRDDLSTERKGVIAHNTYLLALDGDIDFQPNAVELLVDLMKKTPNLGAACGRIHPIGPGPMVWYQRFEYAIGHWLQKATEHMIGCVLCSPGCFSLFRAEGLMDTNVMKTYTTEPTLARDYVQYDQGEDRWLCTLLLQQGWRVEYSAASDALTHAPEGFDEFFNQRRRWVPSTMANILDLLMAYKQTIKVNPDISFPYICYQFVLMGGSILGPGTIFLMLVGAFVAAFKVDNYTAFYLNIAPILLFILVCYFCKAKIQLMLAQLLSVIYALVMVAVLIALVLQVLEDGLLAPSSIFLVAVAMSFIIAALLHPLEFSCLLHGLLYYITIPSMYMLLIIYSLFNLNDVTWGTRETPQAALERQQQQQAEAAQAKGGKKNGKLGFLSGIVPGFGNSQGTDDSEGSFELSFAGLFKLMCCVHAKPKDDTAALILKIHEDVQKTSRKVEHIEKALTITHDMRRTSLSTSSIGSTVGRGSKDLETPQSPFITNLQPQIEVDEDEDERSHEEKPEEIERNDFNPFWIEDKDLRNGPVDFLSKAETTFWTEFIKQYLLPLSEDREKKKKIEAELLDLRNFVVGAFFMFNAVFVTAMFLLQLNKDKIYFNWPLGGTHNFTYRVAEDDILITTEYLQLEPLGLLFVGFYAVVIVVQFTAMLCHRWGTFCHIMCHTTIGICNISTDALTEKQVIEKQGVKAIRKFQNLKTANEDSPNGTVKGKGNAKRRQTIVNMVKQTQNRPKISTMDRAFVKNFEKTIQQRQITTSDKRRNSTLSPSWDPVIDHLITRRNTFLHKRNSIVERRNSQMMDGFGGHRGPQMGNTRRPTADTLV